MDILPLFAQIAEAGVSLDAAVLGAEMRLVVPVQDACTVLELINTPTLVSDVELIPYNPIPGAWNNILTTLVDEGRSIASFYLAENNRLVIKFS